MQASQQKHRNKYKCRHRESGVYSFGHDIREKKVFGHGRLLNPVGDDGASIHMGRAGELTRMQSTYIFLLRHIGVDHASDG
jgi:hypothetical protein